MTLPWTASQVQELSVMVTIYPLPDQPSGWFWFMKVTNRKAEMLQKRTTRCMTVWHPEISASTPEQNDVNTSRQKLTDDSVRQLHHQRCMSQQHAAGAVDAGNMLRLRMHGMPNSATTEGHDSVS
jgi:hypothetical protein